MVSFEEMLKRRKKARQETKSVNNSNAGTLYNSGNAPASYEDALTQRHIQLRNEKEQKRKENAESNRVRINKWFANTESAFVDADEFMSNSTYNGNINKANNINKIFKGVDAETAFVENYLKPYEGTENGANLVNAFKNYKNVIDNYKSNAKEQTDFASQFKSENSYDEALFEAKMSNYNNTTYDKLMKAYDSTDSYKERQYLRNKALEVASSSDLQKEIDALEDEYSTLYNGGTDFEADKRRDEIETELEELDNSIEVKKRAEDKNKFEKKMKSKYSDFEYDKLMKASENAVQDDEKQWLDNYAYEIASSDELKNRIDKLSNEYNDLFNGGTDIEKDNRRDKIEAEIEKLDSQLKAKIQDEDKQENYNNVILNDVKTASTLQKYYALQKAKETEKLLNDTGASIEDIKTSSAKYYKYVQNLRDDEKANIISNYENLKHQGYDVDKLYKYYSREQEEKLTNEQNKLLKDYAEEHPVLGSVASVGLNLGGGVADAVNYIGSEIDSKFYGGDGYINPQNTNVYKAQMVRDTVSKDFNGLGKFLYSTGMSTADFLSTAALSVVPGGQTVGLALLGTSAGVSAANDVIESGGDIDHAVMTGVAAGLAEAIFEKVSLEQLKAFKQGDVKVPKDFVRNLIKGSFTEGTEEAFTDLANAVTDQIINGDLSKLSRQYNNYIANGMSEREAGWQTALELSKQTMLDFAGGALSGGVMSGGAMTINVAGKKISEILSGKDIKYNSQTFNQNSKNANLESNSVNNLISKGKSYEEGTQAYKLAIKLEQQAIKKGDPSKVSDLKLGQLRNAIIEESGKNIKSIRKDVINKAVEVNKDTLTSEEKEIIKKIENDTTLTDKDYDVIDNSKILTNLDKAIFKATSEQRNNLSDAVKATYSPLVDVKGTDLTEYDSSKSNNDMLKQWASDMELNESETENFINGYDPHSMSLKSYAYTYNIYNNYGKFGVMYDEINTDNIPTDIDNTVRINAYKSGLNYRKSYYQTQNALNVAQQELRKRNGGYAEGTVDVSAIKYETVTTAQKQEIKYLEALAQVTGLNIKLVANHNNSKGYISSPNGSYNRKTNTITIDINSKKMREQDAYVRGAMLYTASHELTHVAEQNTDTYEALHSAVVSAIGNDSWERLIAKHTKNVTKVYSAENKTAFEINELASQEALAEACSQMLQDSELITQIADENPSLAKKIINILKDIIEDLRKKIRAATNLNIEEVELLKKGVDNLDEIKGLWENAVKEGIKNQNAKMAVGNFDPNNNISYSRRYNTERSLFSKALNREEWASFYSSLQKYNQRNAFRFGDNAVLIPNNNFPYFYKLVLYDENNGDVSISAVYSLENYDYNIHSKQPNIIKTISELERMEFNEKQTRTILQSYTSVYGTIFKKYNSKSGKFIKLTRKSDSNRTNAEIQSQRGRTPENAQQGISSEIKNKSNNPDVQYSFGGRGAKNADLSLLEKAVKMNYDGNSSEEIRQKTGWFKGYDGKWRYEIDDSKMKFKGVRKSDLHRMSQKLRIENRIAEIEDKIQSGTVTKAEEKEYYDLDDELLEYSVFGTLADYIDHPLLFKAYPQLKDVKIGFTTENVFYGAYSHPGNIITLNFNLPKEEMKSNLIHEIQHAIQEIEGSANGSNVEYWQSNGSDDPYMDYRKTAGEIEARDSQKRLDYTAEQRKNIRPDIDREDVVFAYGSKASFNYDIKKEDIENLRTIGRKSINDFTSEEIKKSEKWARKFYKELGTKSPFFRAWFGDWRANDTQKVSVAKAKGDKRGIQHNIDTGWDINVSRKIFNETLSHNGIANITARDYLPYITDIIEKAVLFDTVVSNKDNQSLFMHSFYSIADIGNGPELLKLYVEELNDVNSEDDIRRAYQLQNIEKKQFAVTGSTKNSFSRISQTANIVTVSDLHALVKQYDKNFNPKSASEVVDKNGEPLVVYHGANAENITVFDENKFNNNEPSGDYVGEGFFFTKNKSTALKYGKNVMATYLNIRNPLIINTEQDAKKFRQTFLGKYENGDQKLRDLIGGDYDYFSIMKENPSIIRKELISRGYDGLIDNLYGQYAVFKSTQVKSATDNIGTFDGDNADIQYQQRYIESFEDTDLSTLDDKEIRVYNKRGWASGLFIDEDRKLLAEKYNELNNRTKQRTDNVLGDGSRVVEVNNKIVLIGGTFEEPEIYCVLAVNAKNETEAEIYKELIRDEFNNYKRNKDTLATLFENVSFYDGQKSYRAYRTENFTYHKGRKDTGERAILPSSFQNYGYTTNNQQRTGDNNKAEQGLSSIQSDDTDVSFQERDNTDSSFSYNDVNYPLKKYGEQQINNWKASKNIIIYENEQQLLSFMDDVSKNKDRNKKIYFGMISDDTANRVYKETGIKLNNYNVTIKGYEIQKILKNSHGDERFEALRGQRAISKEDILLIPQIISKPDKIVLEDKLYEGKPLISFQKTINGKTTVTCYISPKHFDIAVQTMYSGQIKKDSLASATNASRKGDPLSHTSETTKSTTIFNNSLSRNKAIVNNSNMQENENNSDTSYQLRDNEVISNRELLSKALLSVAKTGEEKANLQAYQEGIARLNEDTARLNDINKQIKDISFTKGSDRSQLVKLKNQKDILVKRIHRQDKALLKLESMDTINRILDVEKSKIKKKLGEKYNLKYYEQRNAWDKKKIIRKIEKSLKDIDKLLNRSKADKTVKQGLRDTASKVLALSHINISNADIVRRGVEKATPKEQKLLQEYKSLLDIIDSKMPELQKYKDNLEKTLVNRSDLNINKRSEMLKKEVKLKREELIGTERRKLHQLNSELRELFVRERERMNKTPVQQTLAELSEAYNKTKNAPEVYIRNAFDNNIIEAIDDLKGEIGDTLVKDMNVKQVQKLYKIVTMMKTTLRNANKLFAEDIKLTCEQTSNDVIKEVLNVRHTKELRNLLTKHISDFQWKNLKPIYAFRFIGSKTFEKLFWNLQKGELDWYIDISDAKQFKEDCEKKYGYKSFDFKKIVEFTAMDGSTFTLDLNQMMDIYAASRRPQALQHLLKGGFTFEKNSSDGKLKVKTGAKAYPLTMETIQSITSELTENEKGYAETMQKYLSEVMAKKGNETSMALYGVELFNEDIYWSISSSDAFLQVEEQETTGEFKLKNSGFTKATVRNASNPIVLKGFEENWCNHVNKMSLYHAMTLPLEDFTKVFNYNTGVKSNEENPTSVTGVRSVIKGAFGNSAESYVRQFLRDLNGGIREASRVGIADNMIALSKKAAVFANLSVVLQQPSAVFRATAYINRRYFLPEPNKLVRLQNHHKDWEQLKKYAPIAGIKEMGMFDTGTGKGVLEWLSSGKCDSKVKKVQNIVDNVGSKLPALADEYAWVKLWHAIQRETYAKHGLRIGTEENLVKSGDRFNEVAHMTQVYDSVFSRSAAMRSSQTFDKMATSFMAEPTTIMNMTVDAFIQLKRNSKSGVKRFAKTFSSILISIFANTLLKSIATAGRDDDEDETYGDKYWQAFWGDLIGSVNPLNYYPIMRDIMSVIEGYTTERMDMSLVSDFVVSLKKLMKEDGTTTNNIIDFVGYIANLFGIPVRNVVRDFNAAINTYNTLTTASKDPIISLEMSMSTAYQEAYDKYWQDGYIEDDCEKKAATSVKSKIRKKLRPVYLEAFKNQDTETVKNIRRYMRDSGFYDSLNGVDKVLKDWRESSEEEEERANRAEERKKDK